uniref:SH3 domain-containing protein n=1 Tax=Steinernema glaseri TaxID=37863 RepID=A0A1I7ZM61_9BILA
MSLSGLRKQFNKANQYLSETMGAAAPTKLDDEYNEMERKIDVTYEAIGALTAGVHEYLQPNPATRAKMATMGALSKVRGTTKASPYPQTEGLLSETMVKYGNSLGDESDFGKALCDVGEAYRQMADVKYQLEENVKQNFLDPIAQLQNSDLKDVNHHRTKLKGRRLDYDCKKRKQTRDEELIQAEEKLEESKKLAEQAMYNVLSNDDATGRPRTEHVSKPVLADRTPRSRYSPKHVSRNHPVNRSPVDHLSGAVTNMNFDGPGASTAAPPPYAKSINGSAGSATDSWSLASNTVPSAPPPTHSPALPPRKATAKALYDFEAQNPGELDFKEGQIIDLVSQIDENWFEGTSNGKSGFFPISYVQVLVPLS